MRGFARAALAVSLSVGTVGSAAGAEQAARACGSLSGPPGRDGTVARAGLAQPGKRDRPGRGRGLGSRCLGFVLARARQRLVVVSRRSMPWRPITRCQRPKGCIASTLQPKINVIFEGRLQSTCGLPSRTLPVGAHNTTGTFFFKPASCTSQPSEARSKWRTATLKPGVPKPAFGGTLETAPRNP